MSADRDGNRSNPYRPSAAQCCEACVFGRGEHADWCLAGLSGFSPYLPFGIPSDCEFCPAGECADFDAIGLLGGFAICLKCLRRWRPRRGPKPSIGQFFFEHPCVNRPNRTTPCTT